MNSKFSKRLASDLQNYAAESGIVALASLAKSIGTHPDPLSLLRTSTRRIHAGTKFSDLLALAPRVGLKLLPVEASLNELIKNDALCILHWEDNHFVSMAPAQSSKEKVSIFDPAIGLITITREEFDRKFTGYALVATDSYIADSEELSVPENTTRTSLLSVLPDLKRAIFPIVMLSALLTGLQMIAPIFIQIGIDRVIPSGNTKFLLGLTIIFLFLAVFRIFTSVLRSLLIAITERNVTSKLQALLAQRFIQLPYRTLEGRSQGDLLTDFGAAQAVTRFYSGSALTSVVDAIFVFLFTGILFFYSWIMASMIMAGAFLIVGIRVALVMFERPIQAAAIQASATNDNNFFDLLRTTQQIKIFGVARGRFFRWLRDFSKFIGIEYDLVKFRIFANSTYTGLEEILTLLIGAVGIYLIVVGELTIGALYLVVQYRTMLFAKLSAVVNTLQTWITLDVQIDRFSFILDQEIPNQELLYVDTDSASPAVKAEQLTFSYSELEEPTLRDVNLSINQGEKILIAGPSGGGKTTLLKILVGLYSDFDGSGQIYGLPISDSSLATLHTLTAGVFQGQDVSEASIEDNVRFFDNDLDRENVILGLKQADIWDFVQKLPMQEQTMIGSEIGPLSSGQKQRILLARAFAKQPKILFLDEGTSNLDKETETKVAKALAKVESTVICITHNPKSFLDFDRFYWVESGTVTEISSSELLDRIASG